MTKDQLIFSTLRLIRNQKTSVAASAAGVSSSTIRRLRLPYKEGGTLYPRAQTLDKSAKANGYKLALVKAKEPK